MIKVALIWAIMAGAASADRAVWNPPARYDHPYAGHMVLEQVTQPKVVTMCRALFKAHHFTGPNATIGDRSKGCSWQEAGTCTVITINAPYAGSTSADVFRHENGHCNGWAANHPD